MLVDRTESIHKTMKKNQLPHFKRPHSTTTNSQALSQLFIAAQVRKTKLEEFFKHENHPWPLALSLHGRLRLPSNKSELLLCIEPSVQPEAPSHYDAKVFDGAAMMHALPRENTSTFGEYSDIFIPWTERQRQSCSRIDIGWVFGERYPAMQCYLFTLTYLLCWLLTRRYEQRRIVRTADGGRGQTRLST